MYKRFILSKIILFAYIRQYFLSKTSNIRYPIRTYKSFSAKLTPSNNSQHIIKQLMRQLLCGHWFSEAI